MAVVVEEDILNRTLVIWTGATKASGEPVLLYVPRSAVRPMTRRMTLDTSRVIRGAGKRGRWVSRVYLRQKYDDGLDPAGFISDRMHRKVAARARLALASR